jgi:glycosyltransferase involved in cell wall biosynthesis
MRVAIVVPVYGTGVGGGATNQARGFAFEAVRRGWDVEVWTSAAKSHYDWQNGYPAGATSEAGVIVRRFPITTTPTAAHRELEEAIVLGGDVTADEQFQWLDESRHSVPLYAHISEHAADRDVVITLPYASPITHYASWAAPEHTILWPCLHDEPYAYLEPTRLLLESVQGVMYNSPEELTLSEGRLGIKPRHSFVLGEGVIPLSTIDPSPLQPTTLVYVGRLESGKNVALLYEYVQRYADEGGEIELLVAGTGPLAPPAHPALHYLGYISDVEKARLLGSALALCQPSLNESFSLTIMESWLAQRPVLVHSACDVTRGHVQRSQGGLWFRSYDEFVGAFRWLQTHLELAQRMGARGRAYVQANYTWPAVLDRFGEIIAQWTEQADG